MPRFARITVPSLPHHVTQRGNNKQDVFFVDDDRRVYLEFLYQESASHGLEILGYCLMANHIHLVAVPKTTESLAKAVGRAHFRYTQYINRMHNRTGHLWQNRFFSCPLDKRHFWFAMRYVETNPVRAGMAKFAWDYDWSSAVAHVGGEADRLIDQDSWQRMLSGTDWKSELKRGFDDREIKIIRTATSVGRPLGSDSFMSKLESLIGRRLRALPTGRPKGNSEKKGINR